MDRKRLYVVSSPHLGHDREDNIRTKLEETLEVKLKLIESLAIALRQGSYFSDGLYRELSEVLNRAVEHSSLNGFRRANQRAYNAGGDGFHMYEMGKVAEVFARLKKRGISFAFRPTETEGMEERDMDERDKEMIRNIIANGSAENMLYVGSAHKVECLEGSGLEEYHIGIAPLDDVILAVGSLPKRIEPLKGLPRITKAKIPVEWGIAYI